MQFILVSKFYWGCSNLEPVFVSLFKTINRDDKIISFHAKMTNRTIHNDFYIRFFTSTQNSFFKTFCSGSLTVNAIQPSCWELRIKGQANIEKYNLDWSSGNIYEIKMKLIYLHFIQAKFQQLPSMSIKLELFTHTVCVVHDCNFKVRLLKLLPFFILVFGNTIWWSLEFPWYTRRVIPAIHLH